jgi:hypothetical protein
MSFRARLSTFALIIGMGLIVAVQAAQAAEFGVEKLFAANCEVGFETCGEGAEGPAEVEEAEEQGFRTAGAYVPFGVSDFVLKTEVIQKVPFEAIGPAEFASGGSAKNLRFDAGPGVVTNPEAVPKCSMKDFVSTEVAKGAGVFFESKCPPSTVIGENTVKTVVVIPKGEPFEGDFADVEFSGKVYNLEQPSGLGSDFGVALYLNKEIAGKKIFVHTFIEGNVEWATDYHDYYLIKNVTPGLIESRLVFKGNENEAKEPTGFIRNPTSCSVKGPATRSTLTAESYAGVTRSGSYEDLVGTDNCGLLGFGPTFALSPETAQSDTPDGLTAEASVAHPEPPANDVSDLKAAKVTLPEGLTANPAAVKGLEGCTPEQIGIGTRNAVTCPPRSQIGTVSLNVPTVPAGSLQGPIFLGKPAGKPIEGPPYTIYLDAESARYGVKVRLKGTVEANLATGQLTTTFSELPEAPFNQAVLHFSGGGAAPLANPLVCETTKATSVFTPFAQGVAPVTPEAAFTTEGCSSTPPPFNWTQATSAEPATAGASSTVSLTLERKDGEQYVQGLTNVLPPGLVGLIPAVTLCEEPEAAAGKCSAASQIGTANIGAGAGSEPFHFPGKIYLTGPTEGAPYGLSIVVPAVAGPFNLGNVIARAKIEVNQYTGQVIATDARVPTIIGGVPVRQKSISLTINRQGFERNPTNCGALSTATTLTSTLGASDVIPPTPFTVEGCGALGFSPSLSASTSAKTSLLNGASLKVNIGEVPGQANIKSVVTQLPKALPSRLTTLQKACIAATFEANPASCPPGAIVGTATAITPVLPKPMTGTAYFVSHASEAFPDLDIVLEGSGVKIILVGNTNIGNSGNKKGVTTTTFASSPDVPVSSFTLTLPSGPNSALAANTNLCRNPLVMPTTITGQNGKIVKQNTKIAVTGCGVQIVGHKVIGNTAYLTVQTFAAGRLSGSGPFLASVTRHLSHASNATTLKVPLTAAGRRHRPLTTKVKVSFAPSNHSARSSASVTVRFR